MPERQTASALAAGQQAADQPSVLGWGVFGWAFALLAVPWVYMRSPRMPMTAALAHDEPATHALFERAYVEQLKARQVKAVWIGVLCSIGTVVLMMMIGAAAS